MKTKNKIYILIIAMFAISFFYMNISYADTEEIYESIEVEESKGNVTYASDVTDEMASSTYWADKLGEEADKLLMNSNQIETINQEIIDGSGTGVFDITTKAETKTQSQRKELLVNSIESDFNYMVRNYPNKDRKLYVDGELINNLEYIKALEDAVKDTGFEDDDEKIQLYAVGVKRTEIKMFPTNKVWGYDTPEDPDDESCNSALEVNEPFIINAKCKIGEDTFYWGRTNNCNGWVDAKNVALFDSKEDWLEAWKVDIDGKDFLVVTQDCITLEPSSTAPETSEVQLKIGTVLKLVPKNEIPESVNERSPWNNYVVYLPTRNEDGKYVRAYALIAEHYKVNVGYLPLTQRNLLDVAFTCLGNRYGWGGMLGAMDCSAYAKAIYKCFGLDLPRNTTNQQNVPNKTVNFANMSDEEKETYIEKLPAGTVFYFPGHAMVYVGSENGKNYVISDTGSLSDSVGEVNVRSMYSVIINPLTVRRKNGTTWLSNLTKALIFGEIPTDEEPVGNIDEQDIYVTVDEDAQKGNITYADGISSNMSNSFYWKDLIEDKYRILLSKDKIQKLNNTISDINSKSFLVVTQDRIILEPSILQPEVSEVELPLGTVLELVPEDKIPLNIAERGPWNNYVVYLPIINENGQVEKKYALIPQHYNVSIGYLDLTPENILDVSFNCLGDSYELMNNTEFINSVYKCFGLDLFTDSKLNSDFNDSIIDVSKMSLEEKKQYIENLPVGSVLIIDNEYCIYLGAKEDNQYIISSMNNNINSIVLNKVLLEKLTAVLDFTQIKEKSDEPTNPELIQDTENIQQYEEKYISSYKSSNPKTGDNIILWLIVFVISGVGIVIITKIKRGVL